MLITGAARGIGADAARRLAARGARVSLVGLEPEELERLAAEIGEGAVWFECDVTDRDAVEAAVAGTVERTGGIDVVVANAGIGAGGPIADVDPEDFERVIEVNLLGAWRTIRAALPHVTERRGYVLPIASLAALVPASPGMAAYSASKTAIEAIGRTLRVEVAHEGVDVGVAYFSWIDTDLVRGGDEHPAFRYMRSQLRGPTARTYPVSAAGEAIVRGIERRSRVVAAPSWVKAVAVLRGVIAPLVERQASVVAEEAMRLFREEREAGGDFGAVGAGGNADKQTRRFVRGERTGQPS